MQLTINEELQIYNQSQARSVKRKRTLLILSRVRDTAAFLACVGFVFFLCVIYKG